MLSLAPLLIASGLFLYLGYANFVRSSDAADFIPSQRRDATEIKSSAEFSSSTVAASVSLATIVAAYFNLASLYGAWLLWTALTGACGMLLVYAASGRIAKKLEGYLSIPTLHEYLASEYDAPILQPVSAALTSLGLVLLFATEMIVGSEFLGRSFSNTHPVILTVCMAIVVLTYVLCGGFRAVIKTDGIQMKLIWIAIPLLGAGAWIASDGQAGLELQASDAKTNSGDDGGPQLGWFLAGVLLMNLPTHLSSITVWQRIGACKDAATLKQGLKWSCAGILISWGLLAGVSCLIVAIVPGASGSEVMANLFGRLSATTVGSALVFVLVLGLYSALLSTASTLLIAIGQSLSQDLAGSSIFGQSSEWSVNQIRVSLVVVASTAVGLVWALRSLDFQVEDLIFAIFGGALAMFPPTIATLVLAQEDLSRIRTGAVPSVVSGFLMGWTSAVIGKCLDVPNLVFMSPAIGLGVSMLILIAAFVSCRPRSTPIYDDADATSEAVNESSQC